MNSKLQARLRDLQVRVAIRDFNCRRRNTAAGVWFRVGRLLTAAERAYAISDADATTLGIPEPAGLELQPPKQIYFVTKERLASLASRREIPVRFGPEMLAARNVALVRFDKTLMLRQQSC